MTMLIRMRDLRSLRMVARDGSRHAVLDLFVDGEGMRVTHVVSRLGSWFEDRQCALRASAFDEPDLDAGLWPVAVGREDVARAPEGRAGGAGGPGPEAADGPAALLAPEGAELGPDALSASECEAIGARRAEEPHDRVDLAPPHAGGLARCERLERRPCSVEPPGLSEGHGRASPASGDLMFTLAGKPQIPARPRRS